MGCTSSNIMASHSNFDSAQFDIKPTRDDTLSVVEECA